MIPIRCEWSAMKRLALLSPALAVPLEDDTASGNPVVFQTDIAKPLKQLQVSFTPIQEGSGDPSPVNKRPFVPWEGLDVGQAGKNLLDPSHRNAQGNNAQYYRSGNRFLLKGGQTYTLSANVIPAQINIFKGTNTAIASTNSATLTYTPTENVEVWFDFYVPNSRLPEGGISAVFGMLEVGSTATAYEPYKPITDHAVSFPEPVCGGHVDLATGELWATWKIIDLYEDITSWAISTTYPGGFYARISSNNLGIKERKPFICSHAKYVNTTTSYVYGTCLCDTSINIRIMDENATKTDWTDYIEEQYNNGTPIKVCAELASPVLLGAISPETIRSLKGTNTIWSDANGLISVVFQKKK